MKARPIPFSGPMVRALMDGRKTQARRIVKSNERLDTFDLFGIGETSAAGKNRGFCATFRAPASRWIGPDKPWHTLVRCPYGKPGDVLWCRETWAHYQTVNHVRRSDGRAFDEVSDGLAGYRADGHDTIEDFRRHVALMSECDLEAVEVNGDRWRPSIHMPRWASRITLEIESIRVERLQDISESDARAEGVELFRVKGGVDWWRDYRNEDRALMFPSVSFQSLWKSINGLESWSANPWVWVVEFRPHLMNVDELLKREAA